MNPTPHTTFPGNLMAVDYPGFLSQHDVVYLAPAADGIDGLPIGNGDLGAMLWTPPGELRVAVNKADLWDDGPDGPFTSWGEADEEVSTMLRAACAVSISNGLPAFDRLYLTDFAARLRLAEAEIEVRAATPFSRATLRAFVSQAAGALILRYEDETGEQVPRRVELSRWGTRSLLHWYRRLRRDQPLSFTGTETGTGGSHLWITQRLRDLHFAVAARLDGPAEPRRLHRRAGVFESAPVTKFAGVLYLAVATSEEADDPLVAAIAKVDAAVQRGVVALTEEHRQVWRRYWEASFVDLPPEQDYAENLWYLSNYSAASSCQGRYPPNHINELWSWNRDLRPWAHYYHWNIQPRVWPMHAAGHGELALPYYGWRRAMLDHAIEDARRVHGRDGAFYTDVANRRGYQATDTALSHNLTPGPQIAADFWRHYQYTRDGSFLREEAYPVIREVTRFYLAAVTEREDGRYTFVGTQPYEGSVYTRDTLTDLAHARQLFGIFLEVSVLLNRDGELRQRCQGVLERLAPYVVLPVATEHWVDPNSVADMRPVLFKEIQPGDPTMPMWFAGYKVPGSWSVHANEIPDGVPIHEGMCDPVKHVWIFTSTNMAPIFPADQVGLDAAGTAEFQTAVNTVRALGQDHQGFSLWIIAKARLGLAEELQQSLVDWPQRFQIFPQGFTHWALPNHRWQDTNMHPRHLSEIGVIDSPGETVFWPLALSAHMSIEALPLLQLAVNEMLLQSYSGTLRVFPAVPAAWEGSFRLHAVGRFVVSAARAAGEVTFVLIESRGGEPCRLVNPWPGRSVTWYRQADGWTHLQTIPGDMLIFETEIDGVYLLLPEGDQPERLAVRQHSGRPNQGPKMLGTARLGMPKGF